MKTLLLCKNCLCLIEPSDGQLYPWTHRDANQTSCHRAEPGATLGSNEVAHFTLGQVKGIVEMVGNSSYRLTPEAAIEDLRRILAQYAAMEAEVSK